MIIGNFSYDQRSDIYSGTITTLTLQRSNVVLRPTNKSAEKGPDYRIVQEDDGGTVEFGIPFYRAGRSRSAVVPQRGDVSFRPGGHGHAGVATPAKEAGGGRGRTACAAAIAIVDAQSSPGMIPPTELTLFACQLALAATGFRLSAGTWRSRGCRRSRPCAYNFLPSAVLWPLKPERSDCQ
jgi:hypothetical protein